MSKPSLLRRIFRPWARADELERENYRLLLVDDDIRRRAAEQHVSTAGRATCDIVQEIIADGNKAWNQVQAKDIEIARLMRWVDNGRHALDQCEADRNALAHERDAARENSVGLHVAIGELAEEVNGLKAERDTLVKRLAEVEASERRASYRFAVLQDAHAETVARIGNALDQLSGPRSFDETTPIHVDGAHAATSITDLM